TEHPVETTEDRLNWRAPSDDIDDGYQPHFRKSQRLSQCRRARFWRTPLYVSPSTAATAATTPKPSLLKQETEYEMGVRRVG
ncbi:hypothetical protein NGI46_29485, partial [Peribacillus butanolivorans]|nr:hypothetical protein [Peribacillus butanolivorans]